ncbi:MAG: tyrosine-type recombinase/integrase [Tepidisphaeraceae bacterium]
MENAITAIQPTEAICESSPDSGSRLIDLWLHGRPQTTQRSYRAAADRLTTHIRKPLHQMTLGDLQGFADSLDAAALRPATRRRLLAATKSLFSFGHGLGYLPFDTAKPLRLPPLRDTLAERVIDESSLLRMISLEPNPRNAAMIALMYGAGLRVSEMVAVRWRDLHARSAGEGQVTVFGKGGKTRSVLLPASVFASVQARRTDATDEGFVFASRKGQGRLNTSHVLRITKRAARRAGIAHSVRNHDLRHSHATHSLERGAPISLVAQTLGHASIATTGRYLHARPNDGSGRYLPL